MSLVHVDLRCGGVDATGREGSSGSSGSSLLGMGAGIALAGLLLVLVLLRRRGCWWAGVLQDVTGSNELGSNVVYRVGLETLWRWRSGSAGIVGSIV